MSMELDWSQVWGTFYDWILHPAVFLILLTYHLPSAGLFWLLYLYQVAYQKRQIHNPYALIMYLWIQLGIAFAELAIGLGYATYHYWDQLGEWTGLVVGCRQ